MNRAHSKPRRASICERLEAKSTGCGSYGRLVMLLAEFAHYRSARRLPSWFATLGGNWSVRDDVGKHQKPLRRIFRDYRHHVHHMLSAADFARWEALPEHVTIFRGCGPSIKAGLSWSLERDVAARFPKLYRYVQAEPLLLTVAVARAEILALLTEGGEAEAIVILPERRTVEESPL